MSRKVKANLDGLLADRLRRIAQGRPLSKFDALQGDAVRKLTIIWFNSNPLISPY
jgi:hypothetical protein